MSRRIRGSVSEFRFGSWVYDNRLGIEYVVDAPVRSFAQYSGTAFRADAGTGLPGDGWQDVDVSVDNPDEVWPDVEAAMVAAAPGCTVLMHEDDFEDELGLAVSLAVELG